ncbi:MAG: ABC transporter permease [Promethearchaeota archaeon]
MAKQSTNMIKYIIRRILVMIPMLFLILTFAWILAHLMQVSPITNKVSGIVEPDVLEAELQRIGYYDPWYIQLAKYYQNFFSGTWGTSYVLQEDRPVFDMIATEVFPKTIELMIIPIILSPIIAVKLGITSATHKDQPRDTFIRSLAIIGAGFPIFWIATLVQIFFGYYLGEFTLGAYDFAVFNPNRPGFYGPQLIIPPPLYTLIFFGAIILTIITIILIFKQYTKFKQVNKSKHIFWIVLSLVMFIICVAIICFLTVILYLNSYGTGFRILDSIIANDQLFLWDTILHLILPALVITFVSLAGVTRQTRSSMLDVLDQDYIRTARAKGVLDKDVINIHALRNALLPTSNLIIQGTATALLGSFFVEVTFNYTGFGWYMVRAIFLGDYNVINGLVVFATIILLTGTLVADVMYTIIDPRITYR